MELERTNWNKTGNVIDGVEKEIISSSNYNVVNQKGEQIGTANIHIGGFSLNVNREFGSVEEMKDAIQAALSVMYKEEV